MTRIAIVVGSTRQGRQTDKLAKWVEKNVGQKAEAEVVDLRDYELPLLDEAISPRYNPERKPDPKTKKWLEKIAAFDGYVCITPEYNRSISAVLKNAIDVLDYQLEDKPVALIGHGTTGGAQAIANLRMALPGVGAVTLPQALFFSDPLADSFSEDGELQPELRARHYGPENQLDALIDKLLLYAEALKTLRQ